MRQVSGVLFSILFLLTAFVSAGEFRTDILQYRNDRLYFAGGKDVLIFDNHRFSVFNNQDKQIFSGRIEQALEGVSFSLPTEQFFNTVSLDDCYAVIETANVDSVSDIKIGVNSYWHNIRLTPSTGHGNQLEFLNSIESSIPVLVGTTVNGLIDYTTEVFKTGSDNTKIISHPAPYIAYILPNLSKDVNKENYLTTSLYYRFDDSRLNYLFDGTKPNYIESFIENSEIARSYQYDPERGKQLALNIENRPDSLAVGSDFYLRKAANYFADILVQDRFLVTTESDNRQLDIYIGFAPYLKSDPVKTFEYIVKQLESYNIVLEADHEAIEIIKKHIESYYLAERAASKEYFLKLIDYILKYDLGVFPLFRPTLYFHYSDNLGNVRFTEDGILDYDALQLISFPNTKDSL